MSQKFADKSAKILVVEASQSLRGQVVDVLRAKGFEKPESNNTAGEAILRLGGNSYDWVIASLGGNDPENALHLLKLATMVQQLRGTRITLMLDENEKFVIPLAFELGLLAYHPKRFTKDEINFEIGEFLKTFESHNWNPVLMSAHSLRTFLRSKEMFQSLIYLEEGLAQTFPTQAQFCLNAAEAQFLAKQPENALKTLYHLVLKDPSKTEEARKIAVQHGQGEKFNPGSKAEAIGHLGLKSALILDSDSAVQNSIRDALQEMGVAKVDAMADGEEALNWLKTNEKPSLLVHEWRIPKVSGPNFIQRIRTMGLHDVQLMILSSLVKPADYSITREMGVAAIIEKPFNREYFIKRILDHFHQECMPTEPQAQEKKILQLIAQGKAKEAIPIRDALFANLQVPISKKDLISAELQYAEGQFESARDLSIKALRAGADSLQTLNLLGKCMMQLKDFEAATKFFERAQQMSPTNIERLCSLAEAQQELGNSENAAELADKALTLDANSTAAKETAASVAIASGDVNKAKKLIADMDSLHNVVAYLNNRAISLSRSGKAKESIDVYKNAVQAIPPTRKDVHQLISYNQSLAHVRVGETQDAIKLLQETIKTADSRVKVKAESLKARLEAAVKAGQQVVLRDGTQSDQAAAKGGKGGKGSTQKSGVDAKVAAQNRAASFDALATMSIPRGEICCFKIFTVQEPVDKQALTLIKTLPKFQTGTTLKAG